MKITNEDIYEMCELCSQKREGHLGSSLCILNLLNAIYSFKSSKDVFILSKGHASLGLYLILKKYNYISEDTFKTFCDFDSPLGGHPNFRKVKGIFGSTGSLGHGLPLAIGKALSYKYQKDSRKIYVLIGDGEINEGSNWEAFLLAVHHKLDNIICIVDDNNSSERALSVANVPKSISALGWEVVSIDGHDELKIRNEIEGCAKYPKLIWANTIKGKGISFMENNPEWHHKFPNQNELNLIKSELGLA